MNGSNSEDYLVDSGGDGEDDASTSLIVVAVTKTATSQKEIN